VVIFLEKAIKFLVKIGVTMLALFGIRYLLAFIGVIIPLEWFLIMFFGMAGTYGIILMIVYVIYINFG
jgi:hypothetical protein